ncbi:hypothetical protein AB6A40_010157 [Gnathostoma spinigerum]|uniref:RRM domain-containing protein n=1 Tax=Gnathostoma spinigerum TaxID=75299 RepID=A0ABD6EUF8_9BILA
MASLSSIDSTDPNERTCHVGNLSDKVTEPILKELFIQMGPVENVFIKPHYAFVVFEDVESVPFASDCLDRITLFGQKITVRPRSHTEQVCF